MIVSDIGYSYKKGGIPFVVHTESAQNNKYFGIAELSSM